MKHHKILVVEDNPQVAKLVELILPIAEFDLCAVQNAEAALRVVERFQPDLILVDIQLPGMDGLQLTRRLRVIPGCSELPIVAVTACTRYGDRERAIAAGCTDYVAKPIHTKDFPARVRAYLTDMTEESRRRNAPNPMLGLEEALHEFQRLAIDHLVELEARLPESQHLFETRLKLKRLAAAAAFLECHKAQDELGEAACLTSANHSPDQFLEQLRRCREAIEGSEFRNTTSPSLDVSDATDEGFEIPGMSQLRVEYIGRLQAGLQNLKRSLEDHDFKQIRTFGHNLAGTGTPYGFPSITEYGRTLQRQAEAKNVDGIGLTISELGMSLGNLAPLSPSDQLSVRTPGRK